MRFLFPLLAVILTGWGPVSPAHAGGGAGSTSANFLKIGMGARPVGMGEAFTGVADDTNAVYWNPAGLVLAKGVGFTTTHSEWIEGVHHEFLAAHANFNEQGALGASFTFLGTKEFPEALETPSGDFGGFGSSVSASDFAAAAAYAQRLGLWFSGSFFRSSIVSLKANVVGQRVVNETGYGISFDLGYLYEIKRKTAYLGVTALNVGTKIKGHPQPLLGNVGASYRLRRVLMKRDRLLLAAETDLHSDTGFRMALGTEYAVPFGRTEAAWRAGYRLPSDLGGLAGMTLGFGLTHPLGGLDASLDYAYVPYGVLGTTHRLSLSGRFGGRPIPPLAAVAAPPAFTVQKEVLPVKLRVKGEELIAKWRLSVLDPKGRVVKVFQGEGEPPGEVKWDGTDREGKPVEEGRYRALFDVVDVEGAVGRSEERSFDARVIRRTNYEYKYQFAGDMLFDSGKAELKEGAFLAIAKAARAVLERYPEATITVAGHTDNRPLGRGGSFPDNRALSQARAESVRQALVRMGLDPARLKVVGFADTRPVAPNDTPENRAKNRRVELIVTGSKVVGPEELMEEGRLLFREGNPEHALQRYLAAAKLKPKHPYVYRLIGDAYLALNEKEKAVEAYRRHLRFAPADVEIREWLRRNAPGTASNATAP